MALFPLLSNTIKVPFKLMGLAWLLVMESVTLATLYLAVVLLSFPLKLLLSNSTLPISTVRLPSPTTSGRGSCPGSVVAGGVVSVVG